VSVEDRSGRGARRRRGAARAARRAAVQAEAAADVLLRLRRLRAPDSQAQGGEGRPQRSLPVRLGEEVQEMPRGGSVALAFVFLAQIVRVPPIYFLHIDRTVHDALESRRCTVPQTWGEKWPGNIVRGHFISAKSDDWAALCSRGGSSSVLVISGGKVVATLA